jgi:hypothetical protein
MEIQENNRRSKIRVNFQSRIVIEVPDLAIRLDGDSRNLSLKGIFVETVEDVPLKARCGVQVFLSGTVSPIALKMEGIVTRKEPTGIAIAFDSMDIDSYAELKNIVRYNTENPDDVY